MNDLTEREQAIMELVCLGKTDAEIAMIIGLAESTVKKHLRMCLIKLKAHRRTLAAVRFDRLKRNP